MRTQSVKSDLQTNGREAVRALRGKAEKFASRNLPKAASATEGAGKVVAGLALSSSRALARSMRDRSKTLGKGRRSLPGAAPLLRSAGRFATRSPVLLAAAGTVIALVGYAVWRNRDPVTDAE